MFLTHLNNGMCYGISRVSGVSRRRAAWSSLDIDWLKEKLLSLRGIAEQVSHIYSKIVLPAHPWSAIKLLMHALYVPLYTRIIHAYGYSPIYYIDLFSGCGIDSIQVRGTQLLMPGSPVIAAALAQPQFDKIICVEKDRKYATALRERLKALVPPDKIHVINDDVNTAIDLITALLDDQPRAHYLAFIDPYGLELNWNTLAKLLSYRGDLWVLYQTREVARVRGQPGSTARMTLFFGDERWREFVSEYELLLYYCFKIQTHGRPSVRRNFVIPIAIKGRGFSYHLIFAARETAGGSPWVSVICEYKSRIEKYTPRYVKYAIDIALGRVQALSEFLEPYTAQKKITDFLEITSEDTITGNPMP